jgi:hypothetical protein
MSILEYKMLACINHLVLKNLQFLRLASSIINRLRKENISFVL